MLVPDAVGGEHWARKAIEVAEQTDATVALVHAYNNLGIVPPVVAATSRAPTTCAAAATWPSSIT